MISYEDAKKKATKALKKIVAAYDYGDAFVFSDGDEWDAEIVIMKSNGNAVSMSDYAAISRSDAKPKKLSV